MDHTINQATQIYGYMKTHGSITQLEAFTVLHCSRLAARIADLKAQGIRIMTEMVTDPETKKRFARYSLEAQNGN